MENIVINEYEAFHRILGVDFKRRDGTGSIFQLLPNHRCQIARRSDVEGSYSIICVVA